MVKLFGVDIQKTIAKAMGPGLPKITLVVVTPGTRTASALIGGTNPTKTEYTCRGVIVDYKATQIDGTIIQRGDKQVLILAGTLPAGVKPKPGDQIKSELQVLNVVDVARDPAEATYTCQSRGV